MSASNRRTASSPEALVWRITATACTIHLASIQALLRKAGYRPNQPRAPRGRPDGGRWIDEDDDADLILVAEKPDLPPRKRPSIISVRNLWSVRAAIIIARNVARAAEIADWVWDHARDRIVAYQDEPKFLEELQRLASSPKPGYEIHHIVEQTPARKEGFSEDRINGWENLVRIPTYRHWKITGWYAAKNRNYGGLSPREYLRNSSWEERYRFGLEALRLHGVLK